MKRFLWVCALAALAFASPSVAGERYLGVITATTTKNNSDTAVAFAIPANAKISVQCDVAAYVRVGNSSTLTVTSSNGVKVTADALFLTSTNSGTTSGAYVAALPVSGTANCKVFDRTGNEG